VADSCHVAGGLPVKTIREITMDVLQEKIAAVRQAHREFARIMQLEKCRTCACLHADVLAAILAAIAELRRETDDPELSAAQQDFTAWLDGAAEVPLHQ
jgi:hypothetical protein